MKMSKEERVKQGLKASDMRAKGMSYRVIDAYDMDADVLGYASTKRELNGFINERVEDTDGECYIIVQKWDDDKKTYANN